MTLIAYRFLRKIRSIRQTKSSCAYIDEMSMTLSNSPGNRSKYISLERLFKGACLENVLDELERGGWIKLLKTPGDNDDYVCSVTQKGERVERKALLNVMRFLLFSVAVPVLVAYLTAKCVK